MNLNKITSALRRTLLRWKREENGNVLIESALLFPLLVTMLMGTVDIGQGLLVNKKLISAVHIASDLISRERSLSDDMLDEYMEAARLSLAPYPVNSFGIDIVGIRFTGESATPSVQWRDTIDMNPVVNIESLAGGLGTEDEGVVAVTVAYTYQPRFSGIVSGPIEMQETAFLRGRISSFVQRD